MAVLSKPGPALSIHTNATRTITDIVVPGAVVPFTYARIWNSRGGWRHNWLWDLDVDEDHEGGGCDPNNGLFKGYKVAYPDGRRVSFAKPANNDPCNGVPPGHPGEYQRPAGVLDRLVLGADGPGTATLLMADGSKVIWMNDAEGLHKVVDPHGREVTIKWVGRDTLVTEPGGRWIKISGQYDYGNVQTTWVETSLLQKVTYTERHYVSGQYSYTPQASSNLDPNRKEIRTSTATVTYNDVLDETDQPVKADYIYKWVQPPSQTTNGTPPPDFPRLVWASDPMFDGAMQEVKYIYVDRPYETNGDFYLTAVLEIRWVTRTDALYHPEYDLTRPGNPVFALKMLPRPPGAGFTEEYFTRVETRGDGLPSGNDERRAERTISYFNETTRFGQNRMDHFTDFAFGSSGPNTERHEYDPAKPAFRMPTKITDMRQNETNQLPEPKLGKIDVQTHPDNKTRDWQYTDPNAPYHVHSVTNENNKTTTYRRYAGTNLIEYIDHPDDTYENFTYDPRFGLVATHRMKGGGTETYHYDERGLKRRYCRAPTDEDPNPIPTEYSYDEKDRLKEVKDPRGYVTAYKYNGRHQVTRTTYRHPSGDSYTQSFYNVDGTLAWTADEVHPGAETDPNQRTRYKYDQFKRVIEIRNPYDQERQREEITTKNYDRWDAAMEQPIVGSNKSHVENVVFREVSPTGRIVDQDYDANWRLKAKRIATGTLDEGTTSYRYDPAGNLIWVQDPRGNITEYDFDNRNRKWKQIPPSPFQLEITEWLYDGVGNMEYEKRPDGTERRVQYDSMNRIWKEHQPRKPGEADRFTTYEYDGGNLELVRDPKNQETIFTYDKRDLKKTMKYPNGSLVEGWEYDAVNNMLTRPTADPSLKQHFEYDHRSRVKQMRWSSGVDFADFQYDKAGRLEFAVNPYSTIERHYDDAGRMDGERQILTGVNLNTPAPAVKPTRVVSRMTHGTAGGFDVDLPLIGTGGVECRRSAAGEYTLALTFPQDVTIAGAVVSSGTGTVASANAAGSQVTINLSGVSNAQRLTVKLDGVSDGSQTSTVFIPMHILHGDVDGNGGVDSVDRGLTQSHSGAALTVANFRNDVTANGVVNSSDISLVQSQNLSGLPSDGNGQIDVSYKLYADGKVERLELLGTDYALDYVYDDANRLKTVAGGAVGTYCTYTYDEASNVTQRLYFNDTSQDYIPDNLNRVSTRILNAYDGAGQSTQFFDHTHIYDEMGRLEEMNRAEDSTRDAFKYFSNGELENAWFGLLPDGQSARSSETFVFDATGNRISWKYNQSLTFYGDANQLNQYSITTNGNVHEIEGFGDVSYEYIGDTQLAAASSTGTGTLEFGYDALGRRVRRTENGVATYYAFDGQRPIVEFDAARAVQASTVYGLELDEIIARYIDGTARCFHHDRIGSTSAITDAKGRVEEHYLYDAFGQPYIFNELNEQKPRGRQAGGTMHNNRFLFAGREWVAEFGFYENRARAYHPGLGRFMSEDPLGIQQTGAKPAGAPMLSLQAPKLPEKYTSSEFNLYRYSGNDPINHVDPFGLRDMKVPIRVDELGASASVNSREESERRADGNDTAQAVQQMPGEGPKLHPTLSPGRTLEDHREWRNGRIVVFYRQEERIVYDKAAGAKLVAVGHDHSDVTGKPSPHSSKFSKEDIALAKSGIPVYKMNESNKNQVIRLTPQVDAQGRLNYQTPTEVIVPIVRR